MRWQVQFFKGADVLRHVKYLSQTTTKDPTVQGLYKCISLVHIISGVSTTSDWSRGRWNATDFICTTRLETWETTKDQIIIIFFTYTVHEICIEIYQLLFNYTELVCIQFQLNDKANVEVVKIWQYSEDGKNWRTKWEMFITMMCSTGHINARNGDMRKMATNLGRVDR